MPRSTVCILPAIGFNDLSVPEIPFIAVLAAGMIRAAPFSIFTTTLVQQPEKLRSVNSPAIAYGL